VTGVRLAGAVVMRPEGPGRDPLFITSAATSAATGPATGGMVADAGADAPTIQLDGHLVFPALVNAHDHLHVNAIPPLPAPGPFPNSYAWAAAFGAHFSDPAVAAAVAVPAAVRCWQGGLKNVLAGATTVAHHDPWDPVLDDARFPVRLLRRFGWCHSLGQAPRDGLTGALVDRMARRLGGGPRFGPPVARSFAETPSGAPWIIHLAEGTDEVARGELAALDARGCLAEKTVLVHGVGLGEAGIARVVERGAAVVWCPSSNLALLGATLAPRRLFDAGRLALGTDARLSGARDLLDELRVAAAHGDLTPAELVRLATADGARLLRMAEIGALAPGRRADLVVVRADGGDPFARLLACRRADLRAVVRDGRPAVADPDLADWFAAAGVEAVPVILDGRPKLLAAELARPEALALEPGLVAQRGGPTR
jgi:cytosine/adenosine deaminase-related metal-dependent hydrolase